jgi:preprotein translocase subunit SecG
MSTLQTVVLTGHTIIALLIIILVLLQRGKGADAGAAFGSGASGTVFGASGSSNFFSRATAVMATLFFASSLTLAYMSAQSGARGPDSLLENAPAAEIVEVEQNVGAALPEIPELDEAAEAAATDTDLPALEIPDDAGSEGNE